VIGDEDRLAREAVEQLVPAEPSGFFDAFWKRAAEEERRRAQRWRRVAVAVAVASGVVVAVAGVYAAPAVFSSSTVRSSVVDRAYACAVLPHGGRTWVDLEGFPRIPYVDAQHNPSGKAGPKPAIFSLATVERTGTDGKALPPFSQLGFKDVKGSLFVDRSACRPSPRRVALSHAGLVAQGAVTVQSGLFNDRCLSARRVVFHVRVVLRGGTPTSAKVAVRNDDAKSRPIAYVDWTPKRITYFLDPNCVANK
jgi:hypothetical protein